MKKLILTSVAALSVLSASAAHAAEIIVREDNSRAVTHVFLDGYIQKLDDGFFKHLTEALNDHVIVSLNSRGGDLGAAMRIGSFIRMNQWATSVDNGDTCNSACAVIWLSGIKRFLGQYDRIGLHSAAFTESGKRNDFGNGLVAGYLRTMDVPEEIITHMYLTNPDSLYYVGCAEASAFGLLKGPPAWGPSTSFNWLPKGKPLPRSLNPMIELIPPAGKTPPLMKINP
jgi:hypothetical protein